MPNININELHQDKSQNKVEAFSGKTSVEASDSPLKLKQNRKIEAWSGLPLKANNVNTPFYNQNEIKNSIARLDNNLQDKRSLLEMKNSMVLAASDFHRRIWMGKSLLH